MFFIPKTVHLCGSLSFYMYFCPWQTKEQKAHPVFLRNDALSHETTTGIVRTASTLCALTTFCVINIYPSPVTFGSNRL